MRMFTHKLTLLNQIVACFDNNVVFVAQNVRDLLRNPLLHQINVDFLDVNLTIKLRREFRGLEALLIDAERHGRSDCSVVSVDV